MKKREKKAKEKREKKREKKKKKRKGGREKGTLSNPVSDRPLQSITVIIPCRKERKGKKRAIHPTAICRTVSSSACIMGKVRGAVHESGSSRSGPQIQR